MGLPRKSATQHLPALGGGMVKISPAPISFSRTWETFRAWHSLRTVLKKPWDKTNSITIDVHNLSTFPPGVRKISAESNWDARLRVTLDSKLPGAGLLSGLPRYRIPDP